MGMLDLGGRKDQGLRSDRYFVYMCCSATVQMYTTPIGRKTGYSIPSLTSRVPSTETCSKFSEIQWSACKVAQVSSPSQVGLLPFAPFIFCILTFVGNKLDALQQYCSLNKIYIGRTGKYRRYKKRRLAGADKKQVLDRKREAEADRRWKEKLAQVRLDRKSRHLHRIDDPLALRKFFNHSKYEKIQILRAKEIKKKKHHQKKVKLLKQMKMAISIPKVTNRTGIRKSKSEQVLDSNSLDTVRLKLTSVIQTGVEELQSKGKGISQTINFREVYRQFGKVIDRIISLKFAAPE